MSGTDRKPVMSIFFKMCFISKRKMLENLTSDKGTDKTGCVVLGNIIIILHVFVFYY